MDTENVFMVARWEGVWGMGEELRGIKTSRSSLIAMGSKVQYRNWCIQRTYTHDPWT